MFGFRPDGDKVKDMPATRRIMPYLMRTRNESVVYFEQRIEVAAAKAALDGFVARTGLRATLLHLMIFAAGQVLHQRPRLNRFVSGGRLYQRRGIWVSFSAKKRKSDDGAIVVLKRRIDPTWSFAKLVRHIEGDIDEGRSDKKSSTDKELGLVLALPNLAVRFAVWAMRTLDDWGLLPGAVLRQDPLYASLFLANLGSIQLDAGHHHLYEYGNIPVFAVAGQTQMDVVADGAEVKVVERLPIKYSFDERIEDGLYCAKAIDIVRHIIEQPAPYLDEPAPTA